MSIIAKGNNNTDNFISVSLGVHKAREMPVVKNGQIVVRRIMNLSSSFDHRVIDGADGAKLVQHLKRMLEHPAMIFM